MKTYRMAKPGGLKNLTIIEQDIPEPNAGEVLVRWHATSLNYHDYLVGVGGIPVAEGRVPMSDGAGEVINYRTDKEWGKTIAKRSGGVDHVLDAGATSTLKHSVDAVTVGGHIALIGILGGTTAEIEMVPLILKHIKLTGLAVGSKEMQEKMIAAIETNDIHPVLDKSFAFDELKQAFEYQASGSHFGEITVNYGG